MNSVGARLAICYVLASTLTFASLFLAGRYFIERHAIHALDLLNRSEFEQLKAGVGTIGETLSQDVLRKRVHAMTDDFEIFYVEVDSSNGDIVFRSHDLDDHRIPARPAATIFNVVVDGLGELRAEFFSLGPYKVIIATAKRQ